jgi:hypothetical protein
MISKTAIAHALLLVDKDKRASLPFTCPTTPGWLWAGPWAVRSDKMKAVRVLDGEVAAASAGFLAKASRLPSDPTNRLLLRNGPRESSDGTVNLYVLARPRNGSRLLVGVDARLWPLLEGLDLWGVSSREPVAGSKDGQVQVLVMPRILSEADKDPTPPRPLPERVRAACRAATDALVTHYNPAKTLETMDVTDAAASLVERNALKIVRTPGLAAELREIIAGCQAPAQITDRALYAEAMRKRSSRAGDFHAKVCGSLDRAESAELKREFAARKAIP